MKKKIFALVMAVMMLAMILTGCIQNDIGVKMNKDGSGSISTTIGIEKDFYQNLKEIGSDPFEGKTTTEYTHEDYTYVAYTEVKEYSSYEEMEKALLEMTYDTELIENAQKAQDDEMNADNESFDTSSDDLIVVPYYDEPKVPEKDNHIFSSVNIEKNSGIFYSTYTFSASMNPQSNDGLDYDMNEAFKVTLTVEMPEEITQTKGGTAEGNKITFDIDDITESQEIVAACESTNTGVIIGIVIGLVVLVVGFVCFVKFKK
jgi:hypothetical protein